MKYIGIISILIFLSIFIYLIYLFNKKSTSSPTITIKPSPFPTNTYIPMPPETEKDCIYSDWKDASECSAPCGGGVKEQNRLGTTPHDDPSLCLNTSRIIPCNTQTCASSITPTSNKGTNRIYTTWINLNYKLIFNSDNTVVFRDNKNNTVKNGFITAFLSNDMIQVFYPNDKTTINYQFMLANEDTYNDILSDLNTGIVFNSTTGFFNN